MSTRVMILEFRSDARMRRSRGDSFPFIHGSLLESGWPSRWCVLPVPSDRSGKGTPLLDPLSDECRQALAEELHAWRPDVLLCDETPPPSLSSFLRETAPRIRVHTVMSLGPDRGLSLRLDELLSLLSGAQAPRATQRDEAPAIVDSASPNYEQHSLLPLSAQYSNRPRYLVGGRICAYRRSLASNSSFSAIDDPIVASHRGCSFCDVHRHDVHWRMIRSPLLDLALRQIERHQSTTLDRGSRLAYIIEDSAVSLKPRIFFDRILRLGLRPSSFHLYLRANEFLAMRHEFEAVLPYLRDAGHEIRIMCMGAENFSPIENERFNKGIQPALVWEAMDALKALEIEYPDSFFFSEEGGLSAILFTPWTRLEDLRLNLLAGRRIGVEWTRYALGTRLQIRPESAMAALLDHEGLRAVGFDGDAHVDPVCLGPDEGQIAWRFACPKTALAHRILIRLDPIPEAVSVPEGDPLRLEMRALRRALSPALDGDFVGLAQALVDAIEALGAEGSTRALFEWAASHAEDYSRADPSAPLGYGEAVLVGEVLAHGFERWGARIGPYRLAGQALAWEKDRWSVSLTFDGPKGEFRISVVSGSCADGWMRGSRFGLVHHSRAIAADETRLGRAVLRLLDRNLAPARGAAAELDAPGAARA